MRSYLVLRTWDNQRRWRSRCGFAGVRWASWQDEFGTLIKFSVSKPVSSTYCREFLFSKKIRGGVYSFIWAVVGARTCPPDTLPLDEAVRGYAEIDAPKHVERLVAWRQLREK